MAEEEKLLMRLKNRKRNAIDEAIEVYTPYLSTVLYNMLVCSGTDCRRRISRKSYQMCL